MSDARSKLQEAARIFRYLSDVEVDRVRQAKFRFGGKRGRGDCGSH